MKCPAAAGVQKKSREEVPGECTLHQKGTDAPRRAAVLSRSAKKNAKFAHFAHGIEMSCLIC